MTFLLRTSHGTRLRLILIALLTLSFSASGLSADTITIGAPNDQRNAFPFGGRFGTSLGTRYQQAYSSSEFAPLGPILITSIDFVGGVGTFADSNYTFYLSTITASIDGLSEFNFDSNRGANNTLFARLDLEGPAPATLRINGITPFLYDPSQGNLLLDIVVSPGGVDLVGFVAQYASRSGTAVGIFNRFHNFDGGTFGWGLVTEVEFERAPPTIEAVFGKVNQALANGTLAGSGPGDSATGRIRAWLNMLSAAQLEIESGNIVLACTQLQDVYLRVDGSFPPPDFVAGEATPVLAAMIQALRTELGCL